MTSSEKTRNSISDSLDSSNEESVGSEDPRSLSHEEAADDSRSLSHEEEEEIADPHSLSHEEYSESLSSDESSEDDGEREYDTSIYGSIVDLKESLAQIGININLPDKLCESDPSSQQFETFNELVHNNNINSHLSLHEKDGFTHTTLEINIFEQMLRYFVCSEASINDVINKCKIDNMISLELLNDYYGQ